MRPKTLTKVNYQDLDITMTVAGYPSVRELNREALRYNSSGAPPAPGDRAKL
jgi:isopentenyl diphosphate isomerase/L-lactate dehydrogenase-like FMN-dependent dehydrogenase